MKIALASIVLAYAVSGCGKDAAKAPVHQAATTPSAAPGSRPAKPLSKLKVASGFLGLDIPAGAKQVGADDGTWVRVEYGEQGDSVVIERVDDEAESLAGMKKELATMIENTLAENGTGYFAKYNDGTFGVIVEVTAGAETYTCTAGNRGRVGAAGTTRVRALHDARLLPVSSGDHSAESRPARVSSRVRCCSGSTNGFGAGPGRVGS